MTLAMTNLNILVVEDEDTKIAEWRAAIAAHNADAASKGFTLDAVYSKSVSDAKTLLEFHRFDAAVVDLRLQMEPGVAENNSQGNDLVRHITAAQPLGVVVYTGQRGDAESDTYNDAHVRVMDKGDGLDQVFKWLESNKDIFLRLRAAKSAYNKATAKIFFRSIWPRWSYWTKEDKDGVLSEVVARHIVAHVHDVLLEAGGEATHPEESYFVPPLKGRLDTGDLVDYEGTVCVVVTPRCDLANKGKVSTILLAKCEDISERWKEALAATGSKAGNLRNKLIQHDQTPKQHFLFPMIDSKGVVRGPWMVQFHDLRALQADTAFDELTPLRFASLSPLFVPSLVERFGAYFSRIGTPSFSD
jgi:CheY-like chemotaxis protein